jgi:hypothetical protein
MTDTDRKEDIDAAEGSWREAWPTEDRLDGEAVRALFAWPKGVSAKALAHSICAEIALIVEIPLDALLSEVSLSEPSLEIERIVPRCGPPSYNWKAATGRRLERLQGTIDAILETDRMFGANQYTRSGAKKRAIERAIKRARKSAGLKDLREAPLAEMVERLRQALHYEGRKRRS